MGMMQHIGTASTRDMDRVVATLVSGLETEFGRGAGEGLAHHFLEAEETDFLWEARVEERWLSAYESLDGDGLVLDRIAICGRLGDRWFSAVMLVDGNGMPHGTMGSHSCRTQESAHDAMIDAH
jgi:hypothetical protein